MKRREFFEKAGIGSAALAASVPGLSAAAGRQAAATRQDEERHDHDDHKDMDGPLSHAVVSFGQWNSEPPINRFPNNSPRTQNNHQLIPKTVTIKAGGAVSFIISGFHYVLVYGNRTKPEDIDISKTILPTIFPNPAMPGPPLINDDGNRVYQGLDPSVFPMLPAGTGGMPQMMQDRVEVVRFSEPGRYLVICGVLPHFYDAATGQFIMYGYVRVQK